MNRSFICCVRAGHIKAKTIHLISEHATLVNTCVVTAGFTELAFPEAGGRIYFQTWKTPNVQAISTWNMPDEVGASSCQGGANQAKKVEPHIARPLWGLEI